MKSDDACIVWGVLVDAGVGGISVVKDLQPGDPRVIGPYRVVGLLGQGGMGQVFLAVSPGGRPVAVKAIRPELASDPQFRIRFAREVAAARTVSGMFTAMVVGADVDGPMAWLATAYVPGPSLAEAINEHGPLPEASLLALAAGLAEALAAIHAAGVTHRDLKPSNVLLAEDGPRVIDFGISRAAESTTLTQTGLTIGSPGFMSPEQAIGTNVGPPSDIFSLGTVLAFAATGEGPFGGGTTASLLYRVVHEPADLDRVPPTLRPLIERCLVKDPPQRPTAVALLDAVGALQPTGNWLPESVIRMAAAPPIPTRFTGAPAPTPVDGVPIPSAPTPVDGVPIPPAPTSVDAVPIAAGDGFDATMTSMPGSGPRPPYGATETSRAPGSGSPPLVMGDPPYGQDEPPRRRGRRPLVLASIIGVLVIAGAATAFALGSHGSNPPTQPRPAANVSSVATAAAKSASASPTATKHPKPSASTSTHAATTQPAATSTATFQTHSATTTPTTPTTTTTTTTTTTSPTATTTTSSPTPTTTTQAPTATATATATATNPPASSAPSASASSS